MIVSKGSQRLFDIANVRMVYEPKMGMFLSIIATRRLCNQQIDATRNLTSLLRREANLNNLREFNSAMKDYGLASFLLIRTNLGKQKGDFSGLVMPNSFGGFLLMFWCDILPDYK